MPPKATNSPVKMAGTDEPATCGGFLMLILWKSTWKRFEIAIVAEFKHT